MKDARGASDAALRFEEAEAGTSGNSDSERGYRLFAPIYDLVFGATLQQGRRVAVAALDCQPGERVLEVGIGSGLSLPLYPSGVSVTGIDISPEMLTKAARRLRTLSLAADSRMIRMDASRLAFPDASFDKAALMFSVAGMPDPVRTMHEVRRVCRHGATIVVASRFRSQRSLLRLFDGLLAPIHKLLRYRADLDREAFIEAAGLEVIESRSVNLWGYTTVLICRYR